MSKQFVIGSAEWLEVQQTGFFDRRPPVVAEPPRRMTEREEAAFFKAANRAFKEAGERSHFKRAQTAKRVLVGLAEHYGKPCAYCKRPMNGVRYPTREHKHPRWLGGKLTADNRLIVCRPCNGEKGGRTIREFAMYLTIKGDPRAAIVWKLSDRAPPLGQPPQAPKHTRDSDVWTLVRMWEGARRKADAVTRR